MNQIKEDFHGTLFRPNLDQAKARLIYIESFLQVSKLFFI